MKKILNITIFLSLMIMGINALPVNANPSGDMWKKPVLLAALESHHGKGIVMVIEAEKSRIKLDHGAIKSIGWGPMKMFFDVKKTDLLNNLKVGDEVNFEFLKTDDGRFVIINIKKVE